MTRGVPSLADLLQSDNETEHWQEDGELSAQKAQSHNNITAVVPSLGALLEEEDTGHAPQGSELARRDAGNLSCKASYKVILS